MWIDSSTTHNLGVRSGQRTFFSFSSWFIVGFEVTHETDRFATLYERAENRNNFGTFDDYSTLDVVRIGERAKISEHMIQIHEFYLRCFMLRFRDVVELTIATHTMNSFFKTHTNAHIWKNVNQRMQG